MRLQAIALVCLAVGLAACNKTNPPVAANGQMATVTMKDGSTFAGTVTASDTSAISVQSATGETRTIPMTQVAGVQYGSGMPASAPAPMVTSPAPAPAPSSAMSAPPSGATAPPPVYNAPPPPPTHPLAPVEEFRTIPAGVTLEVRNNGTINSETAGVGQTYSAVVARDVLDTERRVAIPHGSNATLIVREARGQGKLEGRSELALDVASVTVAGRTYRLETEDLVERGQQGVGKNKRTGEFIGGGAALGGIIGAIAGGGKGAAIGALSGAGAGTATQALTRGKAVRVPSETVLSFRLEAPIRIREMR